MFLHQIWLSAKKLNWFDCGIGSGKAIAIKAFCDIGSCIVWSIFNIWLKIVRKMISIWFDFLVLFVMNCNDAETNKRVFCFHSKVVIFEPEEWFVRFYWVECEGAGKIAARILPFVPPGNFRILNPLPAAFESAWWVRGRLIVLTLVHSFSFLPIMVGLVLFLTGLFWPLRI